MLCRQEINADHFASVIICRCQHQPPPPQVEIVEDSDVDVEETVDAVDPVVDLEEVPSVMRRPSG